jgi:hypothetical protein
MASVNVYTAEHSDDMFDEDIVDGSVVGDNLILEKRSGATVDAGNVRGPAGTNGRTVFVGRWATGVSYLVGDVVSFANRMWRCVSAHTSSATQSPAFTTGSWMAMTGIPEGWMQTDPYFTSDNSNGWETFWQTGTPTRTLTTTAGEFESGVRAMKIAWAAAGGLQRLYEKDENVITGGEVIRMEVRAKALVMGSGAAPYLQADLWQTDTAAPPEPFASGLVTTAATEGNQSLTTSWATYVFHAVAANGKPRARFNLNVFGASGAASTVVIDRIRIFKFRDVKYFLEGTTDHTGISASQAITGLSQAVLFSGLQDVWYVTLDLEWEATGTIWNAELLVDGAVYKSSNLNPTGRAPMSKTHKITGQSAGSHTISARVTKLAGNNFRIIGPNSSLYIRR